MVQEMFVLQPYLLTQKIAGWINIVQVVAAFAFSFGMHTPFVFEYRYQQYWLIILPTFIQYGLPMENTNAMNLIIISNSKKTT